MSCEGTPASSTGAFAGGAAGAPERFGPGPFVSSTHVVLVLLAETARALTSILGGELQTDPKTQGSQLKTPLGSWNKLVHHRRCQGTFVEFSEPGEEPRLMEVRLSQEDPDGEGSLLRGWEYAPTESSDQ